MPRLGTQLLGVPRGRLLLGVSRGRLPLAPLRRQATLLRRPLTLPPHSRRRKTALPPWLLLPRRDGCCARRAPAARRVSLAAQPARATPM